MYVEKDDSVIISDLLYYIWNKLKSTSAKDVVSICHQYYTDDNYVFEEKKKLCEAVNIYCGARKKEDKRLKNLEDICATLSSRDSKALFLPKFASIDLNNVPLKDDGNPSLGQIMAALNEIRRNAVTTKMLDKSVNEIRKEFSSANMFPSTSLTPSPVVPAIVVESIAEATANVHLLPPPSTPLVPDAPSESQLPENSVVTRTWSERTANSVESSDGGGGDAGVSATAVRGGGGGGGGSGGVKVLNHSNNRKTSQKRNSSRPRTIIGKNVKEGLTSVKGADLTVNKYLGRFHNDVTEEGVRQFIADQGVSVVELELLDTKHQRFKSFRLRMKRSQLGLVEDDQFWPEGVIVSPFFRPRTKEQQAAVGGSAS